MATDPYVPTDLEDLPRHEQNMAAGVHLPPARSWRAQRPGDLAPGWPEGDLLGSPGPNIGFALKLVHARSHDLTLGLHEPSHDAQVVIADLAMRRAALHGRAPIPEDLDAAISILGYDGSADDGFTSWRALAVAHAGHDYPARRELIDAVADDVLRSDVTDLGARLVEVRSAIRAVSGTD